MKRTLLVAFLSFLSFAGFSQIKDIYGTNTFIGLYGGAGIATKNNYDVGLSGGIEFEKGISKRYGLGLNVFYQGFSLLYDNEQYAARNGQGNAGAMLRHKSAYIFATPKFDYGVGYRQHLHIYVTAGVGFKMSGFDSLRKWDHSFYNPGIGNYDSSIDLSKNINSMVVRLGIGLKQYMYIGNHWRITLTEDFGFLPGSLSKSGSPTDPSRTQYTPQKISPAYISLQLGIMHTKYP